MPGVFCCPTGCASADDAVLFLSVGCANAAEAVSVLDLSVGCAFTESLAAIASLNLASLAAISFSLAATFCASGWLIPWAGRFLLDANAVVAAALVGAPAMPAICPEYAVTLFITSPAR